jgi:hypothetical protein
MRQARRRRAFDLDGRSVLITGGSRPSLAASGANPQGVTRGTVDDSPWVFPSSRKNGPHIAHAQKAIERIVRASGVDFRGQDLRRTAASLMVGAGVPRLVVSKILNRVETGVTAVYDRHGYDLEKRAALLTPGLSRRPSLQPEADCWGRRRKPIRALSCDGRRMGGRAGRPNPRRDRPADRMERRRLRGHREAAPARASRRLAKRHIVAPDADTCAGTRSGGRDERTPQGCETRPQRT